MPIPTLPSAEIVILVALFVPRTKLFGASLINSKVLLPARESRALTIPPSCFNKSLGLSFSLTLSVSASIVNTASSVDAK